jgi:hypothetical protein
VITTNWASPKRFSDQQVNCADHQASAGGGLPRLLHPSHWGNSPSPTAPLPASLAAEAQNAVTDGLRKPHDSLSGTYDLDLLNQIRQGTVGNRSAETDPRS